MKHTVSHDLGQERAKKVTESALSTYAEKFAKYSPKTTWTSPSRAQIAFTVKGMSLSGSVEVKDKTIDLDLDVPFLLRPFQGQAISVIEGEIKSWLAKEKANG
ncbi:MAG TPA: polyhydroxyalkanoic acid system family protein [Polyangiaceae bacterium]|nr:polyhydroxyalkanoic acid system family protein [Polyangiaceae bacterium]